MKKIFALSVAFATGIVFVYGQALRTTELNVFKNGTYFVVKEGILDVENAKARMELPPNPLLGTFWLTTQKETNINKIVYMTDTLKKGRAARSIQDLLRSNKGKKVKLSYKLDEKTMTEISGTIQEFNANAGLVKLKTVDGRFAYIPSSDVKQLFVEETPNETVMGDSLAYLATIEFNREPRDAKVKLTYMQTGIQWIPSYNIKVLNDKELQLEMRALVENFAEIVKDAELTLTVGDPNYRYGRRTEPFASPYFTNLMGNPGYQQTRYQFQNTVGAMDSRAAMPMAENAGVQYNDYQEYATEGTKSNDLFFYKLGKVSIPKNSKANFQIFSQKIPYKDVYKVNIGDYISYASYQAINNNTDQKFEVFHSLKLTNTTKTPFTTAPVFVMNEDLQPLAQDEIQYTPTGGNVSVQLSKSPDIGVKNTEEEKNREERSRVYNKFTYTKVVIQGKIEVNNYQDKSVILNVTKSVTGLMTEVSDNGDIKKPPRNSELNPYSLVEWEIPMNANEKKSITYTYEVYVPSR